ncbi:uncharacterized protein LOC114575542 [Exaiptasia diaphana]|uniref:CUE domain-containing protein n=1 Tax=Exaiptasia diaphana TaxID=2652724 RepID=A0A913YMP3_EXADI|nr:uncharacterized protein LOC114575542 [Exaiptasia diaphana]
MHADSGNNSHVELFSRWWFTMASRNNVSSTLRKVAQQLMSLANHGVSNAALETSDNGAITSSNSTNINTQSSSNSNISTQSSSNNTNINTQSSSNSTNVNTQSSSNNASSSSSNSSTEHRKVFNYMPRASIFRPSASSKKKGKGKLQTCTLKFFRLADIEQDKPPGSIAGTTLSNCGLGPASITIDLNSSMKNLHACLIERYPLLEAAGGYELLLYQRGGEEQGFHQLPSPYLPSRIKDIAGQSQIYIRPLQKNLLELSDESFPRFQCQEPDESPEDAPLVQCMECNEQLSMHQLREHQLKSHGKKRKKTKSSFSDKCFFNESNSSDEDDSVLPSKSTKAKVAKVSDQDEDLEKLSEMFPSETRSDLQNCLKEAGSVTQAIMTLLQPKTSLMISSDDDLDLSESAFGPPSLSEEIYNLQKNFDIGQKEKLKVDEEDILNDAMTYYKDSDFNPSKRLRIVYNGQPAADTGGVVLHFYTQLLIAITGTFFQGDEYRMPIYNSETVACGLMKLVGTIIVHSILQGGPGFPVFSPGIYYYLAKGDVKEAMEVLSVDDCSLETRHIISKIAKAENVETLDQEEIITALSNCGLTLQLTNDNKMRVVRNMIN